MFYHQLPPLNSLKVFDAVVSCGSLSAASRQLSINQSAVSRHVSNLEEFLNCVLLHRDHTGIQLTESGKQLRECSNRALRSVADTCSTILNKHSTGQVLRVSSTSSFALHWLVPRLNLFQEAYPNITINLSVFDTIPCFSSSGVHGAITSAPKIDNNADNVALFQEQLVVVASPNIVATTQPISVEDIIRMQIIHTSSRADLWQSWCQHHDVNVSSEDLNGQLFQDFYMSIAAALSGAGVALVPEVLVRGHLEEKTLSNLTLSPFTTDRYYRFTTSSSYRGDPGLNQLKEWLIRETESERNYNQ